MNQLNEVQSFIGFKMYIEMFTLDVILLDSFVCNFHQANNLSESLNSSSQQNPRFL